VTKDIDTPADLQERQKGTICERNEREVRTYSVDKVREIEREGTAREGSYSSLASLANDTEQAPSSEPAQQPGLNLGHLPGRCNECSWHIETQGHALDCQAAS
jgi:hypothetical protein